MKYESSEVICSDPLWTEVWAFIKLSIDWSADLQLFYRGSIVTTLLASNLHYSSLLDDPKADLSIYLGYTNAHLLFSHLESVYRPIHIFCGPNIDLSDIFENTKIYFKAIFGQKTIGWVFEILNLDIKWHFLSKMTFFIEFVHFQHEKDHNWPFCLKIMSLIIENYLFFSKISIFQVWVYPWVKFKITAWPLNESI